MTDFQTQYAALTDENDHTGAAILAAKAMRGFQGQPNGLGAAYVTILQEIADTTEMQGFISPSQQRLRDAISTEILLTLRLQGVI